MSHGRQPEGECSRFWRAFTSTNELKSPCFSKKSIIREHLTSGCRSWLKNVCSGLVALETFTLLENWRCTQANSYFSYVESSPSSFDCFPKIILIISLALSASIERFVSSLIKQKVPDNIIVQDKSASNKSPFNNTPNGPWYQNGWKYTSVSPGNIPYQNPPGWKRG